MLTVSLPIEILRTRPRLVFWLAALTQALLWVAVPSLFYSAPPGDVAEVLAIGRERLADGAFGPPLAYWLADAALRVCGGHMAGVYLLAQLCVVAMLWAVFQLGSAIVGERHAVLAVLLLTGISVFTIGSPDFGPEVLMLPLWALAVLHLWRACGEGRELYWLALAADFGLMLFTSPLALLLLATTIAFLLIDPRARKAAGSFGAAAAAIVVAFLMLPALLVMQQGGLSLAAGLTRLRSVTAFDRHLLDWLTLVLLVVIAHGGAVIMIAIAANLPRIRRADPAAVVRAPAAPLGRSMIYFLTLAPLFAATVLAVIFSRSDLGGLAPLFVLSGLAVVVAAGDGIRLHHQRLLSTAWFGFLLLPPLLAALGPILLPALLAMELKVTQPADDIARYFTENFERRTGRPLQWVAGDARLAALVGLASARRPHVLRESQSERGRENLAALTQAGAIVLWRATDSAGSPPPHIRAQFPDLVAEVPRAFERPLSGRAPLLRIGWGMIRPRAQAATPQ